MATYAIGDIQGCYQELLQLLEKIDFDAARDRLWLVGDLVNRGPDSLNVLRFLYAHQDSIQIVLGNHDLHLLAIHAGVNAVRPKDTLSALLAAPDGPRLCRWLQSQPLFHYDAKLNFAMVHAGVPPQWSLKDALAHTLSVERFLRSESEALFYFRNMMGNEPLSWHPALSDWEKIRYITNAYTRMRYCTEDGTLDLILKSKPGNEAKNYFPWFLAPHRKMADTPIVFGHWASLNAITLTPNVHAIDTGCVWGQSLTALNLETLERISVASTQPKRSDE